MDNFEHEQMLTTSGFRMLFGGMVLGGSLAAFVPHVVLTFVCTMLMFASPLLGTWMARALARAKANE
jgi:hypothetical protein